MKIFLSKAVQPLKPLKEEDAGSWGKSRRKWESWMPNASMCFFILSQIRNVEEAWRLCSCWDELRLSEASWAWKWRHVSWAGLFLDIGFGDISSVPREMVGEIRAGRTGKWLTGMEDTNPLLDALGRVEAKPGSSWSMCVFGFIASLPKNDDWLYFQRSGTSLLDVLETSL